LSAVNTPDSGAESEAAAAAAAPATANAASRLDQPTEAVYFYQRGQVRVDNKQPDLALADFAQAIKLKPEDTDALIARATLRADRGDPLELNPNTADFLDSRGLVYLRQGNYDKAIADYDAALRPRQPCSRRSPSAPPVSVSRAEGREEPRTRIEHRG